VQQTEFDRQAGVVEIPSHAAQDRGRRTDLFSTDGYHGTTLKQIALRAGVAVQTSCRTPGSNWFVSAAPRSRSHPWSALRVEAALVDVAAMDNWWRTRSNGIFRVTCEHSRLESCMMNARDSLVDES